MCSDVLITRRVVKRPTVMHIISAFTILLEHDFNSYGRIAIVEHATGVYAYDRRKGSVSSAILGHAANRAYLFSPQAPSPIPPPSQC